MSAFFYSRILDTECLCLLKPLGLYYFRLRGSDKWVLKRNFKTICTTKNYKDFKYIIEKMLKEEGYAV